MKNLTIGMLLGLVFIPLTFQAFTESVPSYECVCKIDETLRVKRVERVVCEDFWYDEKGVFTYSNKGIEAEMPGAHCYCINDWGNHLLPQERKQK